MPPEAEEKRTKTCMFNLTNPLLKHMVLDTFMLELRVGPVQRDIA